MPTKKASEETQGTLPDKAMGLKELTELLIKHYGYKQGLFDLVVQFQIGTGAVGPSKESAVPGAMVGLAGVGLKRVEKHGANTLDAAQVNPTLSQRKRKKTGAKS